jgi:N-acetylmuramoyl-L-alanine amidase
VKVPVDFNPLQALRIIGYSMKDTTTAIQSYKIHFVPQDHSKILNEDDRKILFDLVKRYQ